MPEELNMLEITSTDLENWSKTIQSRSQFPRLIRKLILETNPDVSRCDMPYGEDIGRPGYDGEVISSCEARNVPSGVSYWELGTNEKAPKKAEDDYNKRKEKVHPIDAKNITFVFVTPKRWVTGKSWAKKKEDEGFWRNVCVIDACILSCWINEHPVVKLWFSWVCGKIVRGFRHLEYAWEEWRNVCNPPLPSEMFELDITRNKDTFRNWLNQQDEHYLNINADSKDEALAFLYELLQLEEFSNIRNKVIIAEQQCAIDYLTQLVSKGLIPIILDSQIGKRLYSSAPGAHIIRIRPLVYESQERYAINLSSLSSYCIDKVIGLYTSNKLEQSNIILNSCYSRTILRQLLSFNSDLKELDWIANDKIDIELIIPLLFCGYCQKESTKEGFRIFNQEFIQTLYGNTEDELEDVFDKLFDITQMPDAPIWYSCHDSSRYISIKSREESLRQLIKKNCIKRKHWNRFQEAAVKIIKTVREPENGCYSLSPRLYIYRTCILIDAYYDILFSRALYRPESVRVRICEELFSLQGRSFFADNGHFLGLIAESWPDAYLDYLKHAILEDIHCVEYISKWSREIVQSLASLAIHPNYYDKSIELLSKFSLLFRLEDVKDTVYNLFCWWHPQTNASTQLINEAATKLVTANKELAWYIGARQFKIDGDWVGVNDSGVLRGGDWQIPEQHRVNQSGYNIRNNWEILLKNWEHETSDSIIDHINILSEFSSEAQEVSWGAIAEGINRLPDCDRIVCHMCIRSNFRGLQKKSEEGEDLDFDNFKRYGNKCIQSTLPLDHYHRLSWVFLYETQHLFSCKGEWGKSEKCVLRLGRIALKWLHANGYDNYMKLMLSDKTNYNLLGETIVRVLSQDELCSFLISCVKDVSVERYLKTRLIGAITRNISTDEYSNLCSRLHSALNTGDFYNVLLLMPWCPSLQKYIDKLPDHLLQTYWCEACFVYFGNYDAAINSAVSGLLSVDKADTALHAFSYKISINNIQTEELLLLVKIMEKLCRQKYVSKISNCEIEQCLNYLENHEISPEKLAKWELHLFSNLRNNDNKFKRWPLWLWKNTAYSIRLFKHCKTSKEGKCNLSLSVVYRFSQCMGINIPEGFCFETWSRDVVEHSKDHDSREQVLYFCMYIMGYTRRKGKRSWPSASLCKAIQYVIDRGYTDGFVWGIIASIKGFNLYEGSSNVIQILEFQAASIEKNYPRIAVLIRYAALFFSNITNSKNNEREVLKRIGG